MSSIDVIVPCYGYGHFLRECVESVLSQSQVDVRVLIIDDASPDNTAEVANELKKQDARVHFTRHKENKGHIATYNEGIEWASANYLLLLSADDYLLPGALSRAAKLMDEYPEVGFTFGSAIELRDGDTFTRVTSIPSLIDEKAQLILEGRRFIDLMSEASNIVRTPTAVVRTRLQKRVGGYRPELPHAGDMELWLRLAVHASVGVFGACQAVYRLHADNMSRGYYERSALLDLHQRKAVIDYFTEECGNAGADYQKIHRKMLRSLACDAVSWASAAFNDGETQLSRQISQFALSFYPGVKRSLPWIKFSCKRYIGLRGWRAIQPSIRKIQKIRARKQVL